MIKFDACIILTIALLCITNVQAEEFLGEYYGAKVGNNISKSGGAKSSPGESTLAYLVQGGYFQWGYNKNFGISNIFGVGVYADLHGQEKHSNGLAYGGQAYGLDFKLGRSFELWFPFVKLGYGYNSGSGDLREIKQFRPNKSIGIEYKIAPQWSMVLEYKTNRFSKYYTSITNRTVMFGFNFFLTKPDEKKVEEVEIEYEPLPEIIEAPPEFAPPP